MSVKPPRQSIAIAATFTAELLEGPLRFWMAQLGRQCDIGFAPYNQVFQSLLDPASLLSQNDRGLNVLLVRLEDWWRGAGEGEGPAAGETAQQRLARNVDDLLAALTGAAERFRVPQLLCLCPASAELRRDAAAKALLDQMEARLTGALADLSGIYAVSSQEMLALYPVSGHDDPQADRIGHVPYTPSFFDVLATMIARRFHGIHNAPAKVIVVDCDNTLWGGICGEEGPLGVSMTAACLQLQRFLVAQREAGTLVALCTKNNESDVWSVFDNNKEMILKRDHIAAARINWQPKSENIRSLAEELNIALESFVFLDDSAVECAEVQARCPEVLALQFPAVEEKADRLLSHVWSLDHLKLTGEDRGRSDAYADEARRGQLRKHALSLDAFIAALELEIDIGLASAADLPRVAQLTQRTNQFNFTGTRFTRAELEHRWRTGETQCAVLRLRDRFGDYGLVGAALFAERHGALEIDNVLMSCRALGRRVEHRFMSWLDDAAAKRGLRAVRINFIASPRNRPAREFLDGIGAIAQGGPREFAPGEVAARCTAAFAAADTPRESTRGQPVLTNIADDGEGSDINAILRHIATHLADPARISEAIAAWRPVQQRSDDGYVAPRTAIEKTLAELWSSFLGIDRVGATDNFFAIGGQSLIAIQIVFKIHDSFGVELSLGEFLDSRDLADQARRIETLLLEYADEADLAAAIDEMEWAGAGGAPLLAYASRTVA